MSTAEAFSEHRPARRLGAALRRKRRLRAGLTQVVYVVIGVALGLVTPHIPVGFTVSQSETAQMLFAVGAGLVTFIGVVFSLLLLVVQFGSTNFTPRLNLFQNAPIVWHTFAFYTGVLAYSFVAAFDVGDGSDRVSGLVPIVSVLMLLVAVSLYRILQTRAFNSIKLASVLAELDKRGREVIDGVYPDEPPRDDDNDGSPILPGVGRDIVWNEPAGVLQAIDVPRLIHSARQSQAAIEFVVGVGDILHHGRVIAVVRGAAGTQLDKTVLSAVRVGRERTFDQDPTFAFRALVDIGLRALSPAVNDPTTATQVLDTLEDLLRALIARDLHVNTVTGSHGKVRVVLRLPAWRDYVELTFEELVIAGAGHVQVRRRLERLLHDLVTLAPPSRRPALIAEAQLLDSMPATP